MEINFDHRSQLILHFYTKLDTFDGVCHSYLCTWKCDSLNFQS